MAPPPSAPNKRRRRKGPAVRTQSDDDLLEEARQLADREREQLRERLRGHYLKLPATVHEDIRCPLPISTPVEHAKFVVKLR